MILARLNEAGRVSLRSQQLRRRFALAGMILVVLNLRPAITSLSPIYDQIGQSIPLTTTSLGVLGMLPPIGFSLFGFLTPRLINKLGLERSLLFSLALVFSGQVIRSFTNHIWWFGFTSAVSLAGIGFGNVLIPPVIKSYFPDRIGQVTSIYASVIAVSAALPSLVAVPTTQAVGWRVSTGMWAGLALLGAVPWLFLMDGNQKQVQSHSRQNILAWRWPVAWAIMVIFSVGVLTNYTMIAWLPKILTSSAGVSQAMAGMMLSIYNLIGVAPGLVVPIILSRTKRPMVVIAFGVICLLGGNIGLAYLPVYAWAWIFPAGVGLMLVTIGLTLINLRSRTEDGAAALSGFTQGAGYLFAAAGPILVGSLHTLTSNWLAGFWFLQALAIVAFAFGFFAARPKYIEDS